MIEISTLWAMIVSIVPTLSAVIGIIATCVKTIRNNKTIIQPVIDEFQNLRQEVNDKTEMNDVKQQIADLLAQNKILKQELADLITEMRKQKYEITD